MTNREQAQRTMFAALDKELTDDSASYTSNPDYVDEVDTFRDAYTANTKAATAAHADNSGFSKEKLDEKIVLSNLASNLSGKAYVKLINKGKPSIAEQLNTEPTDYRQVADSQCAILAQAAHDLMNANLADLSPSTITAPMLVSLQKEIDKFTNLQGTSETVHEVSPALTKLFKDSFKPVMVTVTHLKLLTRDYQTTDLPFYQRLMASTIIPTVNVHHTYVEVHAVSKTTGKPLEGLIFTLSNTKKTAVTDENGIATFEEVKGGKALMGNDLAGKVRCHQNIVIKSGRLNHYEVIIDDEIS